MVSGQAVHSLVTVVGTHAVSRHYEAMCLWVLPDQYTCFMNIPTKKHIPVTYYMDSQTNKTEIQACLLGIEHYHLPRKVYKREN